MTGNGAAHGPTNQFPIDIDGAPKITLAGKEFAIPLLAWKHNKIIEPLIQDILPTLTRMYGKRAGALATLASLEGRDPLADPDVAIKLAEIMSEVPGSADFGDKLATIVYTAITRAVPGFGRGEFDDMPFGVDELIGAFEIVLKQTGVFRERKLGESSPLARVPEIQQQDRPALATESTGTS